MKTLACFLVTWLTATVLLCWLNNHTAHLHFGGADIALEERGHFFDRCWHWLGVGALYSAINTFIVRFWQMQAESQKFGTPTNEEMPPR